MNNLNLEMDENALQNFEIHCNMLTANVELYWENHAEFLACCKQLLESEYDHIILDLTPVTFVFSAYMGTIGNLLTEAAQSDKRLTIRIAKNLSWLFEIVGFDKMIEVEIVS